MQGIYGIRQRSTGIAYIGSSTNIERRWRRHKTDLNCKRHHAPWLQRAWAKHGAGDFEFIVLEIVAARENLKESERAWIAATPETFNNMQATDRHGVLEHSTSTRAKMSLAQKERFRQNPAPPITDNQKARISAVHKGKVVSDETRAKQSAAAKKRSTSEIMREKGRKGLLNRKYTHLSQEHKAKLSKAHFGRKRANLQEPQP